VFATQNVMLYQGLLNAVSYGNRVYTWLFGQMFNTDVYCVVNNEAVQRRFMP